MTDRPTYKATAERDGKFWFLRVPELNTATQAKRLDQAEYMVRDLIATLLEVPADSFDVSVASTAPADVAELVGRAKSARTGAAIAQHEASQLSREATRALAGKGLPMRDIGVLLDMTHQRAAQLLGAGKHTERTTVYQAACRTPSGKRKR